MHHDQLAQRPRDEPGYIRRSALAWGEGGKTPSAESFELPVTSADLRRRGVKAVSAGRFELPAPRYIRRSAPAWDETPGVGKTASAFRLLQLPIFAGVG